LKPKANGFDKQDARIKKCNDAKRNDLAAGDADKALECGVDKTIADIDAVPRDEI